MLSVALLAGACKKNEENVAPTANNETITTATLSLTNTAHTRKIVTATAENLNTQANFTNAQLKLKASTTYSDSIQLFDKTQTPSAASLLTVTMTDKASNPEPDPAGLQFSLKTG